MAGVCIAYVRSAPRNMSFLFFFLVFLLLSLVSLGWCADVLRTFSLSWNETSILAAVFCDAGLVYVCVYVCVYACVCVAFIRVKRHRHAFCLLYILVTLRLRVSILSPAPPAPCRACNQCFSFVCVCVRVCAPACLPLAVWRPVPFLGGRIRVSALLGRGEGVLHKRKKGKSMDGRRELGGRGPNEQATRRRCGR